MRPVRYGLDYIRDQIVVIDRDNASERRSTDTLSGGETFLASLSLALELSAQVQHAVGAIHLDCLFIDEGFGTLDPDTLRVVADAVRSLQVGAAWSASSPTSRSSEKSLTSG